MSPVNNLVPKVGWNDVVLFVLEGKKEAKESAVADLVFYVLG